jgi:plastocyanin
MRVLTAFLAASLVAVLTADVNGLGAEPDGVGRLEGRVILSHVRGTRLPSTAYAPRAVGPRTTTSTPEIRNVVVYLKRAPFTSALQVSRHEILQEGESFAPRVLAITQGSTVGFPNGDPIYHNVFSLSSAATFDLGRYPQGQSRSRTFTKPGLVKVYCQLHAHMSASIVVLDHPYFTVPELDGSFTLAQLPVGRFEVVGWHERVGERAQTVEIRAGQTTTLDISLPVGDRP